MGFQVEPSMLDFLFDSLSVQEAFDVLIKVVKERKRTGSRNYVLTMKDVRVEEKRPSKVNEDVPVKESFEIVLDGAAECQPMLGGSGYVGLLKDRFGRFERMLDERVDSGGVGPISNLRKLSSNKKGSARIRGLVLQKRWYGDRLIVTLEDDTGSVKIVVVGEAIRKFESVLLDEMIIVEVKLTERGFTCENLYHLDIPDRKPRLAEEDVWAVFLSDIHYGSSKFDEGGFDRFVDWMGGRLGEGGVVKRIKYVFLLGDLIGEEEPGAAGGKMEDMYAGLFGLVSRLRHDVRIFVIPGECDATRVALPQSPILRGFAKGLYSLNNLMMLGNPSWVRLNGVMCLLYHGQSLDDVFGQLEGKKVEVKPCDGMKALLRARHLVPSLGMTCPVGPDKYDMMVVERIPDVFVCGHRHTRDTDSYRGTLLISTPSWLNRGETDYGGRAAVVNLRTFEVLWRG